MDLSPIKREILEALLLYAKPVKAMQLSKDTEKTFAPVQMHLIGLAKMGYAHTPQKGTYMISREGKKALGLPDTTRELASAILTQLPPDKAFHFFLGIAKPTHIYANGIIEFCRQIPEVNLDSIAFHVNRGDFEAWLRSLGDLELAARVGFLRRRKFCGEELRIRLLEVANNRCTVLTELTR
jgi:hypothetical protein